VEVNRDQTRQRSLVHQITSYYEFVPTFFEHVKAVEEILDKTYLLTYILHGGESFLGS